LNTLDHLLTKQPAIAPTPHTPRTVKILLVDDSPEILSVVQALLAADNHRIVTASNGLEAVEKFIHEQPDLVLMDVVMPDIDGFETTRRIKALAKDDKWVPVVMLTSLDEAADFARGLDAGADDYLTKPINAELLCTKISFMKRVVALQANLFELKQIQTIFDHVLDGIIATNERGIVVSYNHGAERLFGYRREEILGRNITMLMSIPEAHRHDAYVARYRSSGQPTVMGMGRDIFGRRKDGSMIPISVGLTEVQWAGARHFIGIVSDISERKRLEHMQQRTADALQHYHDRSEEEKRITQELVARMVRNKELEDPQLQWHVLPSETFSGDLIAARRARDGKLFVLTADATGHGLAAAISLLPVVGIFYAMVEKGFALVDIVAEMNKRLHETMPIGRFLAASVFSVDQANHTIEIWNGGMPERLLCQHDGTMIKLHSQHTPLGILPFEQFDATCEAFRWENTGYLIALSDGVLEARNSRGEALGFERIREAVQSARGDSPFPFILDRLKDHLELTPPHDDISLAVVTLT